MQLISKFNKGIISCVIDSFSIFSKYTWFVPLKDKKGMTIVNAFQKILDDSIKLHLERKPDKIWVKEG